MEKEKLEIFKRLQEKKQQLEAYEKERQRASLSLHDQDSDMPDIDNETFPGMKDIFYSKKKFLSFIFVMISPDDFVVRCPGLSGRFELDGRDVKVSGQSRDILFKKRHLANQP